MVVSKTKTTLRRVKGAPVDGSKKRDRGGAAKGSTVHAAGRRRSLSRGDSKAVDDSASAKLAKSQLKKQKREKNSSLLASITSHWETLRQTAKSRPGGKGGEASENENENEKEKEKEKERTDEKAVLVDRILDLCGDRVGDLVGSSKGARVVQSCVKYGGVGARGRVWAGVVGRRGGVVEASKNPYGRFVVSKLVMVAGKDVLEGTFLCLRCVSCLR